MNGPAIEKGHLVKVTLRDGVERQYLAMDVEHLSRGERRISLLADPDNPKRTDEAP